LLRIDDLDSNRVREEYLDDIFFSLEWMGIEPDEGPGSVREFQEKYCQRNRISRYENYLGGLEKIDFLFSCSCSRKEIAFRSGSEKYDGHCLNRNIPYRPGLSQRIKPNTKRESKWFEEMPYPILRKKDGQPSYHLASCVDDLEYGVDLILRGNDLHTASSFHKDLTEIMDSEVSNKQYVHHGILVDSKGKKLSKSNNTSSWNKAGREKKKLLEFLGKSLGLNKTRFDNLEQFIPAFDPKKMVNQTKKFTY
jgi:glutamyl-Q tRNA(Asp) synthetase